MHMETNNKNFLSNLGAHQIEVTEEKKDWGVLAGLRRTLSFWCSATVKKKKKVN